MPSYLSIGLPGDLTIFLLNANANHSLDNRLACDYHGRIGLLRCFRFLQSQAHKATQIRLHTHIQRPKLHKNAMRRKDLGLP